MAPAVPPSLKKIKVFLTRAEELDRDKGNPESRVVAYSCRQYAVLAGIPLAGSDAAAKACLGDLLSQLEKEKAAMAVFSKQEHWKIGRQVADRVFNRADAEDARGAADKGTAKTFYAAGTFYEILQQFYEDEVEGGELDEARTEAKARQDEEEQRRIYCKWKATDILNAVKEGRTPTPGGYRKEEAGDAPLPSLGSGEEQGGLPPSPSVPSSNFLNDADRNNAPSSPTNNRTTTPGFELSLNGNVSVEEVQEGDEDEGTEEIFVPGAAKKAAENTGDGLFVEDLPSPMDPPPPYQDYAPATSHSMTPQLPPPAATKPLPPPRNPGPPQNSGMLSSIFGKSSKKKMSKAELADAIELTKFALAALQNGDGDLGRERLEQALDVCRSTTHSTKAKLKSKLKLKSSTKKMTAAAELAEFALTAFQKGDDSEGKKRLKEAIAVWEG